MRIPSRAVLVLPIAGCLALGALTAPGPAAAVSEAQHAAPHVPAATAPAAPAFPAAVAVASDQAGNQFVFWKGQDNNLWGATYSAASSSWTSAPTAIGGMWPLASQPSVLVDAPSGGTEVVYVFWTGTDGGLWYAEGTVSQGTADSPTTIGSWSGPHTVAGLGPLGSGPSAVLVPSGNQAGIDVFWKGADSALWSAVLSGVGGVLSRASGPTSLGDGPLGSAPSAGAGYGGNVYVYWQGAGDNTHVWEAYYNGGAASWYGPIDLGAWTGDTASAPSVAIGPNDRQYVFWQGADRNLYYAYWNGYWTGWVYAGMGPLGSAPAAAIATNGAAAPFGSNGFSVLWKGTDANVWRALLSNSSGSWSGPVLQGYGPLSS